MTIAVVSALYLLGLTLILHILSLSKNIQKLSETAPLLDFWIAAFVWAPSIVGLFAFGLIPALIILGVQLFYLFSYATAHSLYSRIRHGHKGGKLLQSLGKNLGRPRVVFGFVITLLAVPVFTLIRIGQLTVYPLLQWSVDFPAYKHSDWIQLSRHKFEGLVGLDLLWCLYCEWAAGVYALGGEMVRNNESFWCPIRFRSDKHCENCSLDFPDLKEWIPPAGKIEDVQALLEKKHPPGTSPQAWYSHPSRKKNNREEFSA